LLGLTVFCEPYSERESSRYIAQSVCHQHPVGVVVCDKPSAY
jgi:hypothetical protein